MKNSFLKNRINAFLKKRTFAFLLSVILLVPVVCATCLTALGYVGELSGDTKAYIGSSFSVTLTLDTPAEGCMGYLEFDSSVLSISDVVSGDNALEEDFFYDDASGLLIVDYSQPAEKMATFTFNVSDDAASGTSTTVKFVSWEVVNGFDSEYMDDLAFEVSLAEPDLRYTAKLNGASEATQGESFTLRLALDNGAFGYRGVLSYDDSVLKLDKISAVNGDLKEELTYDKNTGIAVLTHSTRVTKMFKLTFTVLDNASLGKTTVTFSDGEALNGSRKTSVNDASCTVKITKKASSDATLKSLSLKVFAGDEDKNGFAPALTPNFSGSVLSYNATVSNEYSLYTLDGVCNDSTATIVSATEGTLQEGMNTLSITVRAEDGTEVSYTVILLRETLPDVSEETSDETSSEPETSEEEPDVSDEESEETSVPGDDSSEETSGSPGPVGSTSDDSDSEESSDDDDSSFGAVVMAFLEPVLAFLEDHFWIVIGVTGGFLLILLMLLIVQWKRVSKKKAHPVVVDHSLIAATAIKQAKQDLKNGLIRSFRAEFGDRIPEDTKALHQYVLCALTHRMGSPYVAVGNLISFLKNGSGVSLQGTDSVGGAYVLPVIMSESGEKSFRMEGLIITYKKDNYQQSETCHLRIHADKVGQPIEEVLDFESK